MDPEEKSRGLEGGQVTRFLEHTRDVMKQAEHRRVNPQVSNHSPVSCNHVAAAARSL